MIDSAGDGQFAEIVDLLRAGDAQEVELRVRAHLLVNPRDTQAVVLLAIALGMLGRTVEAIEQYRWLIEIEPNEPAHHNNLATSLREASDLDGAERSYRHALSLDPHDAPALASLGILRWQQGDAVDTRDLMLAAWRIDPGLPEACIYGALACHECADGDMPKRLVAGCENWDYLGPILECDLASVLMQIERSSDAEHRLRALMQRPDAENLARLRLAGHLERHNRLDAAEALLEGAQFDDIDRNEERGVRASLALRRGRHQEAIDHYRQLVSVGSSIASAPQWFALAKAYDLSNDAAGAMDALATAHALQMQQAVRLAPDLVAEGSNPLSLTQYPVDASSHQRWIEDPQAPSPQRSPIFIVGFPRSGTTLLEQMLDAHPGLRSMDERAFVQNVITEMQSSGRLRYPDDLDQLSESDLEALRATYWRCVGNVVQLGDDEQLVDKNPLNVLALPMIHRLFPNARIVLALRHPCDVILSNYMQSFRAPGYQVLCSSLPRIARGYANAMDFWVSHAELFKPAVLELRYEDLLDDVVTQTRRLADHLSLADASALEKFQEHARAKGFISTPSYAQVIEPLNKQAVGRWHRYREYLEAVLPILDPAMRRWGYTR